MMSTNQTRSLPIANAVGRILVDSKNFKSDSVKYNEPKVWGISNCGGWHAWKEKEGRESEEDQEAETDRGSASFWNYYRNG